MREGVRDFRLGQGLLGVAAGGILRRAERLRGGRSIGIRGDGLWRAGRSGTRLGRGGKPSFRGAGRAHSGGGF